MPLKLAQQVMIAYEAADRHIPDSDLDDEQPLTLDVRLTLGDIRRVRRWLADVERGGQLAAEREKAIREHEDSL
jgi:hypothetical protein